MYRNGIFGLYLCLVIAVMAEIAVSVLSFRIVIDPNLLLVLGIIDTVLILAVLGGLTVNLAAEDQQENEQALE